jgi:hypothetical protein
VGFAGLQVYPTVSPVDIVQAKGDHVLHGEAKARQQEEHGAVASTAGGAVVIDGQHPLNLLWSQAWRERRMSPLGRGKSGSL